MHFCPTTLSCIDIIKWCLTVVILFKAANGWVEFFDHINWHHIKIKPTVKTYYNIEATLRSKPGENTDITVHTLFFSLQGIWICHWGLCASGSKESQPLVALWCFHWNLWWTHVPQLQRCRHLFCCQDALVSMSSQSIIIMLCVLLWVIVYSVVTLIFIVQ